MEGYNVTSSRLSRRLDWRNIGYLDSFTVGVRDSEERTVSIKFLRDSQEMEERDPEALKKIIETKFSEQASLDDPNQTFLD